MEWFTKKRIITLGLSVVSVLLIGIIALYYSLDTKEDQFTKVITQQQELKALLQQVRVLQRVWKDGRYSPVTKPECIAAIPEHRRSCNPGFLECYLAEWNESKKERFYPVIVNEKMVNVVSRSLQDSPMLPFAYKVVVEGNQPFSSRFQVFLEDSCNQVYLPGRVYQYQRGPNLWRWDNLGQEIYIDKYLVSRMEINLWDWAVGNKTKRQWGKRELYLPASGLKIGEMEQYCRFKGGELLTAHLFDAATYHPGDISKINPYEVGTSLYPWTRLDKKSFLYKMQQGDPNIEFEKRYCLLIYSQECREAKVPYWQFVTNSTTWSGVYEVMGGIPEVMRNVIHPRFNLFVSSFYLPMASRWNRLGLRAIWNGTGFELNDFKWDPSEKMEKVEVISPETPVKVGFRCTRNYYHEIY